MRWPGLIALQCFLYLFWLPFPLVAGPAEITAIVVDLKQLQRSEDVQLTRAASTAREPLALGVKLEVGDSLENLSGKTVVELKCPNGTIYTFRNNFRVVLIPPTQAGCAVDVLSGSLDVLADRPTAVNAGGVRLGSEGTVYSVTVDRSAGAARLRIAVFEGQVNISGDEPIGQSAVLAIREKDRSRSPIDRVQDILPLAATFARLDVSRARNAERDSEAFQALKVRHAQVLTMPNDRERRIVLARAQFHYGVQNSNASYQLRRLGMTERDLQVNPEPLGRPVPPQSGAGRPVPPQSGTLVCAVQVIEPRPSQEVKSKIEVTGNASIPKGHHLWVFARRIDYSLLDLWWPQREGTVDAKTGKWSVLATLGVAADVGWEFEFTAAVFTPEQHLRLRDYLLEAMASGDFRPIEMPAATCVAAVVKVRRR